MEDITVQKVVDTVFAFPLPAEQGSKCRIRIFIEDGAQTVVIASHIPGSRGTSITNMFEDVATEVRRSYPEHFCSTDSQPVLEPIWVQQYPAGSLHLEKEKRLHLVTFDQVQDGIFIHPRWKQITEKDDEAHSIHQLLVK